jgi:hypothetical protein
MLTVLVGMPASLMASEGERHPQAGDVTIGASLRDRSDEELTVMAAQWDALDRHQRRVLLTEMKSRMSGNGAGAGTLRIRTERRYGRIIRQPDGRLIRIETQVVHVRPASPEELTAARQAFGVGFEQRVGSRVAAAEQPGEVRLPLDEMIEAVESAIRLQPLPVLPAADIRR